LFTGKSNKNLLTQKKDLLAASQGLLDKPIASILDLNTPSLEAWVFQAKPATVRCLLNAEAILADFHDIAEYLQEPAPIEPENDPDNDLDYQNENFDPDNPLPHDKLGVPPSASTMFHVSTLFHLSSQSTL
jgi:hypothetical protein